MSDITIAAAVAAVTSLVVATIGPWVTRFVDAAMERQLVASSVNLQHLAPLRQQLAESAFRHQQLLKDLPLRQKDLLVGVDHLPSKPLAWFAGEGCYLMSTAYYTSRLLAELVRLRDAYPFLRLKDKKKDGELTAAAARIRLTLAGEGGLWYALQEAIGEDMTGPDGRLAGYADFCRAVQDERRGVWYHQLINLYQALAAGHGVDRIERLVTAMEQLSHILDAAVGASASVSDRLRLEAEERSRRRAA